MQDFHMKLVLNVPASKVYEAIWSTEGVRNWWTRFCEISEAVGGVSKFHFPQAGFFRRYENHQIGAEQIGRMGVCGFAASARLGLVGFARLGWHQNPL